jgi:hypothetical protein
VTKNENWIVGHSDIIVSFFPAFEFQYMQLSAFPNLPL